VEEEEEEEEEFPSLVLLAFLASRRFYKLQLNRDVNCVYQLTHPHHPDEDL
jgi:hypothetical protein